MNPWVAVGIITWVAIVVCYLGLAAVLREVRLLRHQVSRMSYAASSLPAEGVEAPARSGTGIQLPPSVVGGEPAVVLALTSGCPLCRVVLARVDELGDSLATRPILLTYESSETWGDLPATVRIVRDDDAWSQVAHLSPPLLLRVAADGTATDLNLPVDAHDVDETLAAWGALPQKTGR